MQINDFLKKAPAIAHLAVILFMTGVLLQFTGKIALYITPYFLSAIFGGFALFRHFSKGNEDKLNMIGFIEVALSFLPFILLLIFVIGFNFITKQ